MSKSVAKTFIPLSSAIAVLCIAHFSVDKSYAQKSKTNKDRIILASEHIQSKPSPEQRKVLVFSATNGFRHKSIPTGLDAISVLAEKSDAFIPVISNDLNHFKKENINHFDAIIFLNTTGNVFGPNKAEIKKMSPAELQAAKELEIQLKANFDAFIQSGKGFVGIHAATDTYKDWPAYNEMIGGVFDGHPWRSSTQVSIMVEPGKENHPLVASWQGKAQDFKEEIYQLKDPYQSKQYDMLLRLDTEKSDMNVKGIKRTDNDFGVSWTKSYGKGRVFYCSLGHNDHIYWNSKILDHYLAGIQYAIGDLKIDDTK